MSLYLCVFDDDEEVDGVAVGRYSDFGNFRDWIAVTLENGRAGARFPTVMLHSDCDGEWTVDECRLLGAELEIIGEELRTHPPTGSLSDWQRSVIARVGLEVKSLYDCFIDVDGVPLVERLLALARLAEGCGLAILFQ